MSRNGLRSAMGWTQTPSLSSGFTLIELLIVIIIISILASLILVGVLYALKASKMDLTSSMIRSIAGALETYKMKFGDYPPSSLQIFLGRTKLSNDSNNGIEALVACVSTQNQGGPFFRPPSEQHIVNTDNDKVTKNLTNWYFSDKQLYEFKDIFGNLFIYFHSTDYSGQRIASAKYKLTYGASVTEIKPYKADITKGKYQLFSVGPDGKPATEDDIKNW